jgi:hypothetical protein
LDHIHPQFFSVGGALVIRTVISSAQALGALAGKGKTQMHFFRQKKQKSPPSSEDEPMGVSRVKTFFGNTAIRATHSRG